MAEDRPIPFLSHLEELRKRLVRVLVILLLGFLVCWNFAEPIFRFLTRPVRAAMPQSESRLIFTGVSEAFFTYLKVAFIAALFLTLPFVLYQIWAFVSPGLYKQEKKLLFPIVSCSTLLFLAGSLFCYYVVFPAAFGFFMSYSSDTIQPFLTMKEYLSFATRFLLAFGLIFQMPLLAYFLSRLGIVNYMAMAKFRRYAIVINFIIAAILTPTPDMVNQLLMAGPLVILYEASILVARVFGRKPEEDKEGAAVPG